MSVEWEGIKQKFLFKLLDCKLSENENKIPFGVDIDCVPIDFLKLLKGGVHLRSLIFYSLYPFPLNITFIKNAIRKGYVKLYKIDGVCVIDSSPFFEKHKEIESSYEEIIEAIQEGQRFYRSIVLNTKIEYVQDELEELNENFHFEYKRKLFFDLPIIEGFRYLVLGDDEGKGVVLDRLGKGKISLTIADIDKELIEREKAFIRHKADFKVIDTRLFNNKIVLKPFDVIISYALYNTSLYNIVNFLRTNLRNCGIGIISYYPALQEVYEEELKILEYLNHYNLYPVEKTPYFIKVIKTIC